MDLFFFKSYLIDWGRQPASCSLNGKVFSKRISTVTETHFVSDMDRKQQDYVRNMKDATDVKIKLARKRGEVEYYHVKVVIATCLLG